MRRSLHPPETGQLFAERYELREKIGEGGMGTVYRAWDQQQQRDCALKLLPTTGFHFTRFKREFRATNRIDHPHCIRVYDLDEIDRQWFYTMEYMPGGTIERLSFRQIEDIVYVALQLLAALDSIHGHDIIHRDLKPQNILVSDWNTAQVKITDFGIAKVADLTEKDLAAGDFLGSIYYIAPEQAEGRAVDPRTDLYALGVILYELIAGRPPIPRKAQTVRGWFRTLKTTHPEHLANAASHCPGSIAQIVMRLLEPNRARRFSSAASVYDAFRLWFDQQPLAYKVPTLPPLVRAPYLGAPDFVGRENEIKQLENFVDRLIEKDAETPSTPRPILATLSGPAGMGKSRLLGHIMDRARENNVSVAIGTCKTEPGASFDAIAPLIARISWDGGPPPEAVNPPEPSEAATQRDPLPQRTQATMRNAPKKRQRTQVLHPGPDDLIAREREALAFQRSTGEAVLRAGKKKVCLYVLEDLQWADPANLRLLTYLVRVVGLAQRRNEDIRVAFVVTHRESNETALDALYNQAHEFSGLHRVGLSSLSKEAVTHLVASMLMSPANALVKKLAEELTDRPDVSPLFVAQALQVLFSRGALKKHDDQWTLTENSTDLPKNLSAAIGDRAARFAVDTQQVLAAAAVAGRTFSVEMLVDLTGIHPIAILDNLDEAVQEDFIEESDEAPESYRFNHDRFRESIYESLNQEERISLHKKLAEWLEESDEDISPADIAHHHRAAGNAQDAWAFADQAGAEALAESAFDRAHALYATAFKDAEKAGIDPDEQSWEHAADASLHLGRLDQAKTYYETSLSKTQDNRAREHLIGKMAELAYRRSSDTDAVGALESALAQLGVRTEKSGWLSRLRLTAIAVRCLFLAFRSPRSQTQRDKKEHISCRICAWLSERHYYDDYEQAMRYSFRATHFAHNLEPSPSSIISFSQMGFGIALLGKKVFARRFFRLSTACSNATNAPLEEAWAMTMLGSSLVTEANVVGAQSAYTQAEDLLKNIKDTLRRAQVWVFYADLLLGVDETIKASRVSADLSKIADEVDDHRMQGWAHYIAGLLAIRLERKKEGLRLLKISEAMSAEGQTQIWGYVAASCWCFHNSIDSSDEQLLQKAQVVAHEFGTRRLRHPSFSPDAVFVAVAALHVLRTNRLPRTMEKDVFTSIRRGRKVARAIAAQKPLLKAAVGAWKIVNGRVEKGTKEVIGAMNLAAQLGFWGHLKDIYQLGTAILVEEQDRQILSDRHQELRRPIQSTGLPVVK